MPSRVVPARSRLGFPARDQARVFVIPTDPAKPDFLVNHPLERFLRGRRLDAGVRHTWGCARGDAWGRSSRSPPTDEGRAPPLRAAWILGARGVAALRLRPDWSHVHADARTTPYRWMEAEEDLRCPCYYTRNFFLKKVRPVAPHHPPTPPRRHSSFPSVCVASSPRASRHHPARVHVPLLSLPLPLISSACTCGTTAAPRVSTRTTPTSSPRSTRTDSRTSTPTSPRSSRVAGIISLAPGSSSGGRRSVSRARPRRVRPPRTPRGFEMAPTRRHGARGARRRRVGIREKTIRARSAARARDGGGRAQAAASRRLRVPRALARVLSRASRGGGAFRTEWIRTVAAEHHEHERTSSVRAGRVHSPARSPRRRVSSRPSPPRSSEATRRRLPARHRSTTTARSPSRTRWEKKWTWRTTTTTAR